MVKFILTFKGVTLKEYDEADVLTIGRRPDNDIHIDNMAVSGVHAKIEKRGGDFVLTDLNSLNGTYVNSRRITQVVLHPNDQITIGKHVLVYKGRTREEASKEVPESGRFGDTMAIGAGVPTPPAQRAPQEPEVVGYLTIIRKSGRPREVELKKKITLIGKGEDADIEVKGLFVGKRTAMISRRPHGYFISHIEGIGKTKVNGEAIKQNILVKLNDGDTIEVGGVKMIFNTK